MMDERLHAPKSCRQLHDDPELQLFARQLQRFGEDGDCAYERALINLYQKLFEQRRRQLEALRCAGL